MMTRAQKTIRKERYEKYLNSSEWEAKRKLVFARDGRACRSCGAANRVLHCHHLTYARFGHEYLEDLLTLCERCHFDFHFVKQPVLVERVKAERKKLRKSRAGTCLFCGEKFNPKVYSGGGGWYCSDDCKKKSPSGQVKAARRARHLARRKAKVQTRTVFVDPEVLRNEGSDAALAKVKKINRRTEA